MRRAVLLAALALFPASVSAQVIRVQAVGETIDVQGWKVHLDKNADGSSTCAAMWKFDDDSAVGFAADSNQKTFLVVSEPDADLVKDRRYQVKYSVDGAKPKTAMGIATSKVMLVVPIIDPDTDFGAFGKGKAITVEYGGESYEEPLDKPRAAIQALGRCIAGIPAG